VSVVGLGTWQFGSSEWGYGEDYARNVAGPLVTRALDLGINLIDTAEIYAFGRSERIVGKALSGRRDEAFIATKVLPVLPLPPVVVRRGRRSATRLGIRQIDLYQIHWPNPLVPLSSQMAGMRQLRAEGLVRHVGVSNYSLDRWKAAERALGAPVLSNQVHFSLLSPGPDRELAPYAAKQGRLLIAYSPLEQGMLSGKYDVDHPPSGTMRKLRYRNLDQTQPVIQALRDIAAHHGASPSQVALAWLLRRPNVVVIPGASSVEQLENNSAAADLLLSDEEDSRLTGAAVKR
jgi:aryl-alcohol dehydrogenase-like predicted oxidoreductase